MSCDPSVLTVAKPVPAGHTKVSGHLVRSYTYNLTGHDQEARCPFRLTSGRSEKNIVVTRLQFIIIQSSRQCIAGAHEDRKENTYTPGPGLDDD